MSERLAYVAAVAAALGIIGRPQHELFRKIESARLMNMSVDEAVAFISAPAITPPAA